MAPRPISRQLGFSRFARCGGLESQSFNARAAPMFGPLQTRFSPTVQLRKPRGEYACAIRCEKDWPLAELWLKKPSFAIWAEWRSAAPTSASFTLSRARPCIERKVLI